MKPYAERELFILNYLRERGRSSMGGVDVLNAEFVNAYVLTVSNQNVYHYILRNRKNKAKD